jgi:hypothetical protein
VTAIGALTATSCLVAESTATRITPFYEFRNAVSNANAADYVNKAEAGVASRPDFEDMRQHLLTLYAGVEVSHSYLHEGDVYDCVPLMQQPSVRLLGITEIAAPPPPLVEHADAAAGGPVAVKQMADDEAVDRFGNSTHCEEGTIPMRRITLEEMTRFESLKAFLSKSPGEAGPPRPDTADPCTGNCPHKYSFTFQNVTNVGGNSKLNVWSPNVNTKIGEIFSLSQQWYVGGSGSKTQTVEVGWQNYPAKYGSNSSHLFIFHTPDDYQTGCYNLDCAGFVQTNGSVHLGGGFSNYSHTNSTQYEITITVLLYKGNWWMYYGGAAFGYYPGSLYHGGQLTKAATLVEYGTESVQSGGTWPGEGSGAWSSEGWEKAAYQRDVFHYTSPTAAFWDSLTRDIPSPSCYTITGPSFSSSAGWGEYFYEGGPGGKSC